VVVILGGISRPQTGY